jgi:NAD(P)H-dependent FMN reductase
MRSWTWSRTVSTCRCSLRRGYSPGYGHSSPWATSTFRLCRLFRFLPALSEAHHARRAERRASASGLKAAAITRGSSSATTWGWPGAGIAFAFEAQAKDLIEQGRLVRVLEDWCPYYPGFYLYYPSHRQLPATLRAFVDFARAMPLHNFNIPAALKLWIDQLYRAGKVFDYIDGRPQGLLRGKKAVILTSSGGVFTDGTRFASLNHAKPHLKTILGIFGVTNVTFLDAAGTKPLRSGEVDREAFMRPHRAAIQAYFDAVAPL